jgi:hypothetical protein
MAPLPQLLPGRGIMQALATNFNTMTLMPPPTDNWYMDSGASSHMVSNSDSLSQFHPPTPFTPHHIIVGNGSYLPVTSIGSTSFQLPADNSLHLHNILVSPHIIKNLIYVRRFTNDNNCSVEFCPLGLFYEGSHNEERHRQVQ